MSWMINTNDLASVASFADAERVWAAGKPWKNEDPSWRQLAGRRMTHKRIVKVSDTRYECVLYKTAIVTYVPDGVELQCYNSVSTHAFACALSPRGTRPVSRHGRMFWNVSTPEGDQFLSSGASLILRDLGNGLWKLLSKPEEHHEWAYDPKLGAATRKKLAPYALWHKISLRLGVIKNRRAANHTLALKAFLNDCGNPERYPVFAQLYGAPKDFLPEAYKITGARYKVPVPTHRLPRSFA